MNNVSGLNICMVVVLMVVGNADMQQNNVQIIQCNQEHRMDGKVTLAECTMAV